MCYDPSISRVWYIHNNLVDVNCCLAGETLLLHASHLRHVDVAKYLLQQGADPSISSDLVITPLHHAAGVVLLANP